MRLEFESNASAFPLVENDTVTESVPSEGEQLLRAGVKAAQEGRRSEAKALLMRVTEVEPDNENAWLWLASISEYPEELLVFLNHVLRVNPENSRAIDWKKATKSLLAKTLVQRGVDAAREDRKFFARQCFEQAVEQDAENELAWLWLASVADSESEKAEIFEKVLTINPANETALESVRTFRSSRISEVLKDAVNEAIEGNHSAAQQMLAVVLDENDSLEEAWVLKAHLSNSFEERAESLLKLRILNPENEMARACLSSWRMLVDANSSQDDTKNFAQVDEEFAPVELPVPEAPTDQQFVVPEGFAGPDSPTQDLNSVPGFSYQPSEHLNGETKMDLEEPAAEVENEMAAEIEAEEDEMHAAFLELGDFDDAPQTSAAGLDSASEENFQMDLDNGGSNEVADDEEWKNTSPEVFFGYVQKSETDAEAQPVAEPAGEAALATDDTQQFSSAPENYYYPQPEAASDNSPEPGAFESVSMPEEYGDDPEEMNFQDAPHNERFAAVEEPEYFEQEQAVESSEPAPQPTYFEQEQAVESSEPAPQATYFEQEQAVESSEPAPQATYFEPAQQAEAFEPAPEAAVEAPAVPSPFAEVKNERALCPFCSTENERQAFSCSSCNAVLSLSDLDAAFNADEGNKELLELAVMSFEREHESFGLGAEKLASLGIGHINLKNYRQGYMYLLEAVKANPSNVVLDAQVNAFAIRLAEFEKQQTAHESMAKNRKILVVDDSPTVRKLISSKLEKCGHEVFCAVDGVDALEKLNGLTPDLILLDITMPRMDGYQVCKLIRSNESMKDVPVVMISGKDGFFDKVRGRMAGTTDYITKPFGPETLMKTVENYLS